MNDPHNNEENGLPEAATRRQGFAWIWLVPLIAALVAGYLGYERYSRLGPLVVVTFSSADGLTAGQTPVRYKSLQVGTVERVRLNEDLTRVRAEMRMTREVEDRVGEGARFWVVRPRLSAGSVTGLDTLVSGSYVEFDPAPPGGEALREFTGLEDAPGVRAGEPGRVFTLRANKLGSLDRGSPVFFRDVAVGEVLSFEPPGLDGEIKLRAFVRSPYDAYLRDGSRFWNASGASVQFGPGGVRLELASIRALVAGGVAFDTPPEARDQPPVPDSAVFELYDSREAAESATSPGRLTFLTYFGGSVRGLAVGSPVELRGMRVGSVIDVRLEFVRETETFRVRVRLAVEPARISYPSGRSQEEIRVLVERMVAQGVRAQLRSGSLLTGQMVVALDAVPDAEPATVRIQGEEIVLPSVEGGGDVMTAMAAVAGKLENFPLDQIGRNLAGTLEAVNGLVAGPELGQALSALTGTLEQARGLVRRTDEGLAPLLRRLPSIAADLDAAITRAGSAVGAIESGYGPNSDINRQLEQLMEQATDAARSVRLLADYLDRHPEALIRGRSGGAFER